MDCFAEPLGAHSRGRLARNDGAGSGCLKIESENGALRARASISYPGHYPL
jgi:hypothetical protein